VLIRSDSKTHRDLEARSSLGKTVLHYAASWGHLETVKVLLDRNADINAKSYEGETPLLASMAHMGTPEIAFLILERGADVNPQWTSSGYTALHVAVLRGHSKLVKALLEKGANINKQTHLGLSPVHLATYQFNADVVKILLDHDADVQLKATNGMNALQFALSHAVVDIIWVLSEATLQRFPSDKHKMDIVSQSLEMENLLGPKQDVQSNDRVEVISRICRLLDDDHLYPYVAASALWFSSRHDEAIEFFHRYLERDPANATISDINEVRHPAYYTVGNLLQGICSACRKAVIGPRYSCKQCIGWDLCSDCYARPVWPNHVSKDVHELVRIPKENWTPNR
jgi:Ankyrin repeats (many copies)/Zinc finger, ZZ type